MKSDMKVNVGITIYDIILTGSVIVLFYIFLSNIFNLTKITLSFN